MLSWRQHAVLTVIDPENAISHGLLIGYAYASLVHYSIFLVLPVYVYYILILIKLLNA